LENILASLVLSLRTEAKVAQFRPVLSQIFARRYNRLVWPAIQEYFAAMRARAGNIGLR
jgi:hypothetical protein